MAEENQTGTENAGDAGQQNTGNNDATAGGQQGDTSDAAGQDEVAGLKTAAAVEREKRQTAEERAQTAETVAQDLRDQMAIQAANAPQSQAQTSQQTLFQSVAKQFGIDHEIATPEECGRIFEGMLQITTSRQTQQSFVNSHPDYAEVVGVQVGNQFQYAQPLLRALQANPALANALRNSPNAATLAYEIAKNDSQYLADKAEAAKSDKQKAAEKAETKIVEANKQLSVSAAKGGGELDFAAKVAAMSPEELRAHNEAVMAKAI